MQFFNKALVVGKDSESEVVEHLYELILELHAIDSSVLLAVMPQLEFKLKVRYSLSLSIVSIHFFSLLLLFLQSTDTDERFEVTKLLANMFSPKSSKLATENRPLWNCFLGR